MKRTPLTSVRFLYRLFGAAYPKRSAKMKMHPKTFSVVSVCIYVLLMNSCCTVFPWKEKITQTDHRTVSATVETRYFEPHALLIAFPKGSGLQEFKGSITLRDSSQQLFSWDISSRNATQCNWIEDHDAYILNWKDTNQLNLFLKRSEKYSLIARFVIRPKEGSIWFSSLRGVGLCIPRAEQGGGGNAIEPPYHPSTTPSKSRATP
jgi:hypothetical protein